MRASVRVGAAHVPLPLGLIGLPPAPALPRPLRGKPLVERAALRARWRRVGRWSWSSLGRLGREEAGGVIPQIRPRGSLVASPPVLGMLQPAYPSSPSGALFCPLSLLHQDLDFVKVAKRLCLGVVGYVFSLNSGCHLGSVLLYRGPRIQHWEAHACFWPGRGGEPLDSGHCCLNQLLA